MAVGSMQSWWKDSSCAATIFDQQKVAPICQKDRLCPEGGWELFEGHCYLFVSQALAQWADAEMDCNEKGGHLASIHSFAENNFIRGIAPNHWFWIGGSDTTVEVRFSIYVLYIHGFLCTGGVSFALFISLLISKLLQLCR
jgi:hypothetical protein